MNNLFWRKGLPRLGKGWHWLMTARQSVPRLGRVHDTADGPHVFWTDGHSVHLSKVDITAHCPVPEPPPSKPYGDSSIDYQGIAGDYARKHAAALDLCEDLIAIVHCLSGHPRDWRVCTSMCRHLQERLDKARTL